MGIGNPVGTAYIKLPRLQFLMNHANIALVLPRLVASITGKGVGVASFVYLLLPRLSIQATGLHGLIGLTSNTLKLPLLDIDSTGLHGIIGGTSTPLLLPRLVLVSNSRLGYLGTAALKLKRLKLISTGISGIVGSATLSLPLLNIVGRIYTANKGSVVLVLPTLRTITFGEEELGVKLYGVPIRKGIAMNLVNWAVTEYIDYPFNSFAYFNGVQLGFKEDGIFDLDHGEDDDGQDILAYIEGGTEDLFKKFMSRLREAWIESRQDGPLVLKVIMGEEETSPVAELPIESVSDQMHEERIKFPRGLKGRYASFRLENVSGSDVDIKRIKIFLEEVQRRR
jgi:hypothetical protein